MFYGVLIMVLILQTVSVMSSNRLEHKTPQFNEVIPFSDIILICILREEMPNDLPMFSSLSLNAIIENYICVMIQYDLFHFKVTIIYFIATLTL